MIICFQNCSDNKRMPKINNKSTLLEAAFQTQLDTDAFPDRQKRKTDLVLLTTL